MQYVYVQEDKESIFCMGIYDDLYTAIGHVMEEIWEFKENYKDKGSVYKTTELYDLEGDSGWGITVTYKAPTWKKSYKQNHYILKHWQKEDEEHAA